MFKFPMYYDRRCTKFRGHLYPTKRYTTVDIKRRWNQIPTNLNKEIRGIRWEKQSNMLRNSLQHFAKRGYINEKRMKSR
ncbi:hypothetical protein T06_15521 [Trichinella sp. T6]|nr:hypothetical protein T06_15521 [Trichinella sp. T6]